MHRTNLKKKKLARARKAGPFPAFITCAVVAPFKVLAFRMCVATVGPVALVHICNYHTLIT